MEVCVGAYSETKDADGKTQRLCDMVKSQVEEKTNKTFAEFQAVKYRKQIVSGTNYVIKVHVGCCSYIHVKVFESLPSCMIIVDVMGVEENHTRDDALIPF